MVYCFDCQQVNLILIIIPISTTDASASGVSDARELWENKRKPFTAEFIELDPSDVHPPSIPSWFLHTNALVLAIGMNLQCWQLAFVTFARQDDFEAQVQEKGIQADIVCCMQHLQASWLFSRVLDLEYVLVSFANLHNLSFSKDSYALRVKNGQRSFWIMYHHFSNLVATFSAWLLIRQRYGTVTTWIFSYILISSLFCFKLLFKINYLLSMGDHPPTKQNMYCWHLWLSC